MSRWISVRIAVMVLVCIWFLPSVWGAGVIGEDITGHSWWKAGDLEYVFADPESENLVEETESYQLLRQVGIASIGCHYDSDMDRYTYEILTNQHLAPQGGSTQSCFGVSEWGYNIVMELLEASYPLENIKSVTGVGWSSTESCSREYRILISGVRADGDQSVYLWRGDAGEWVDLGTRNALWSDWTDETILSASTAHSFLTGDIMIVVTRDIAGTSHVYKVDGLSAMASGEMPVIQELDWAKMFPFVDQSAATTVVAYAESADTAVAVLGTLEGSFDQEVYYRGVPKLVSCPSFVQLNCRRPNWTGAEIPAGCLDSCTFKLRINPRTDMRLPGISVSVSEPDLRDSDGRIAGKLTVVEFNGDESLRYSWRISSQNDSKSFMQSRLPEVRTEIHAEGSILMYKNTGSVSQDLESSLIVDIDDPLFSSGLIVSSPDADRPSLNYEKRDIIHPFVSSDLDDDFQIEWPLKSRVVDSDDTSISLEFYDFSQSGYPDVSISSAELGVDPLYVLEGSLNGDSNLIFSMSAEDFRAHFPGPQRYYIRAVIRNDLTGEVERSTDGQTVMDWFMVDDGFHGFVSRSRYKNGPGKQGPWGPGHHRLWTKDNVARTIRSDGGFDYVIFKQRFANTDQGYWVEELRTGLVKYNSAGEFQDYIILPDQFDPEMILGSIVNYNLDEIIYCESVNQIYGVLMIKENTGTCYMTHAYLVTYDLDLHDWVRVEREGAMKIRLERVDKGPAFDNSDGLSVHRVPNVAISYRADGSPGYLYAAWPMGKTAQVCYFYQMCFNAAKWIHDRSSGKGYFVFNSCDESDDIWTSIEPTHNPIVRITNKDGSNYIHLFTVDHHYWMKESELAAYLSEGLKRGSSMQLWSPAADVYPNFYEGISAEYSDRFGSADILDRLFDANPVTGNRPAGMGVDSAVTGGTDSVPDNRLLVAGRVSFGPVVTSHILMFNEILDYGLTDGENKLPAVWKDCGPGQYSRCVIQDNLTASPWSENDKTWEHTCVLNWRLADTICKVNLSMDPNTQKMLAIWTNWHIKPDLCEFNGFFNKERKVAYRVKEAEAGTWSPRDLPTVFQENSTLGIHDLSVLQHVDMELPVTMFYCSGENYDYRPLLNPDYWYADRFNYEYHYAFHALMRQTIDVN